ncbi:MAG: hypothetical protein ABI237_10495 [Ginsengibacter sp.]
MKIKNISAFIIAASLTPTFAFCQDTASSSKPQTKLQKFFHPANANNSTTANLDSTKATTPATVATEKNTNTVNNTQKKNENGVAEANKIVNTPQTIDKTNQPAVVPVSVNNPASNPVNTNPIYRDTRLGSSSPLYNTYEKNSNGAGSVTTNPNKG